VTAFQRLLAGAGVAVDRAALERAYDASGAWLGGVWKRHRDVPVGAHVRSILDAVDRRLAGRLDAATLAALADAYARPALAVPPTVDPGAAAALAALQARGCTLALVCNTMRTPGTALRQLLAHYGLLTWFTHTTFSDEVGVRKPDPAIFGLTLHAIGAEPETTVHVGDDPILDVRGAHAAGLRAIHVAPTPRKLTPAPAATIPSLAALPAAIAALDE
jgi:HAD superfamily hydrolase (TIGR01509 family)